MLTVATLPAYLRRKGVLPQDGVYSARELGWGVSNVVFRVDGPSDCLVVKQSLPKLRVAAEWPADRRRIVTEHACMAYLGELLPDGSVPTVRFFDDTDLVLGMSCAPPGARLWKECLLAGDVDVRVAARAGALLGEIHARSSSDPRASERFADRQNFLELRVDPYHRTAAAAHPAFAATIEAEVERLLATRTALVLGDYCPKNAFVCDDRLLLIDFEVAHWGDPAFDVAFALNHFILKAFHLPERARELIACAHGFWSAYVPRLTRGGANDPVRTEANTVRELGCLLLARIDGKSPVEYLTDEERRDQVRALATTVLAGSETSLGPVLDLALNDIRAHV